MKTTSNFFSRE